MHEQRQVYSMRASSIMMQALPQRAIPAHEVTGPRFRATKRLLGGGFFALLSLKRAFPRSRAKPLLFQNLCG